MYDSFDNTYQATIGIDFLSKTMYLEVGRSAASIQYLASSIQKPVSIIQLTASSKQHPVSSIQYPVSSIQYPALADGAAADCSLQPPGLGSCCVSAPGHQPLHKGCSGPPLHHLLHHLLLRHLHPCSSSTPCSKSTCRRNSSAPPPPCARA